MGERGVVLANTTQSGTNRLGDPEARALGPGWTSCDHARFNPTAADSSSFRNSSSARSAGAPNVVHSFGFIEVGAQLGKASTIVGLGLAVEDWWSILPMIWIPGVEAAGEKASQLRIAEGSHT